MAAKKKQQARKQPRPPTRAPSRLPRTKRAEPAPRPRLPRSDESWHLDRHARSAVTDMVLEGAVDDAVEQRAHALGWTPPKKTPAPPPVRHEFKPLEGRP